MAKYKRRRPARKKWKREHSHGYSSEGKQRKLDASLREFKKEALVAV